MSTNTMRIFSAGSLVLALAAAWPARTASAQALPTASRSIGISVFGAGSRDDPDYGDPGYGFIAGADVSRPYHGFDPAIELRFGKASGSAVTENTYEGGLKIAKTLGPAGRFHPYGELQLGYGTIAFKFPIYGYTNDNSFVYGVGGGLDLDLIGGVGVKGDFQFERWRLGTEQNALTPYSVSLGVVYRIPSLFGKRH